MNTSDPAIAASPELLTLTTAAANNDWSQSFTSDTSVLFANGPATITARFAGSKYSAPGQAGMLVTLQYKFGNGKSFAIAVGDDRRQDSGMTMSEIGVKWLGGKAPNPQICAP